VALREFDGYACGRCGRRRRPRWSEKGAWLSAGGRWRDEGALGRGVACAVRATATRGRRNLHAAALLWSWSATVPIDSVDSDAIGEAWQRVSKSIYPLIRGSFVQMPNMSFVAQGTSYNSYSKIKLEFVTAREKIQSKVRLTALSVIKT